MGEVVNLRTARKAKKRADKEKKAAENRAAFGRSKVERDQAEKTNARLTRDLDNAKRGDDDDPPLPEGA